MSNNTKKTLIVAPNAGFANRLRAMAGAIWLAEKLNMNIEHLWIGSPYKCCPYKHIQDIHDKSFEYFFKQSIPRCDYNIMKNHVNKAYNSDMPGSNPSCWYNFQSYGQKLLDIPNVMNLNLVTERMDNSENILIETSHFNQLKITDEDMYKIYSKYFIPHNNFMEMLDNIPPDTIGISIRCNYDFMHSFPDSKINEVLLIKWLKTIEQPVLFFSDNLTLRDRMRKHIKHPIIPRFESIKHNDNGFLSFLSLSKCSKLYGTILSSFYEEAAKFGGIKSQPLSDKHLTQMIEITAK